MLSEYVVYQKCFKYVYLTSILGEWLCRVSSQMDPYWYYCEPLKWQFQSNFSWVVWFQSCFKPFLAQFHIKIYPKRPNKHIFVTIFWDLICYLRSQMDLHWCYWKPWKLNFNPIFCKLSASNHVLNYFSLSFTLKTFRKDPTTLYVDQYLGFQMLSLSIKMDLGYPFSQDW